MATLDDHFLDDSMIEDMQTVARTINRPTKHASNPLLGNGAWTWDRDINYCTARNVGSTVNLWYMGVTTGAELYSCLATSTDGEAFTRPNLGLVSYGGNSNNNILMGENSWITGVWHDDTLTPKFLGCGEGKNGEALYGIYLVGSADGASWTPLKTVFAQANNGSALYIEGRTILRRTDGRWIAYGLRGHPQERRSPCAFISATSDPTGSWTDAGILIDSKTQDTQRYHFSPAKVGDSFLAIANRFVKSNEKMDNAELLTSRDGITWRTIDQTWFAVGTAGAWDDEWVMPSGTPIELGNVWYFYYTGSAANHAAALPRSVYLGAVTIPKGRIAGIGTNGVARLKPITLGATDVLTVNCNAAGGSLKVELMDEQHRVLPGYSRNDCTAITTDTFGTTVAWGQLGLPASQTVKIVFVLADATLHGVRIGVA